MDSPRRLRAGWNVFLCYFVSVQTAESVQCPFCGQTFELEIDVSVREQAFVTDCEICCRPLEVRVVCEDGAVAHLAVSSMG
jgi:hypothetical protein